MKSTDSDSYEMNDGNKEKSKNKHFSMNICHVNGGYKETEGEFLKEEKAYTCLDESEFTVVDKTMKGNTKLSDDFQLIGSFVKNKIYGTFTKKILYRRLPILNWLPKYDLNSAIGDLVAGITVGLTLIPQGLAYSNIVKVPVEYGLYGSFLGAFVYIFFGSCKDVSIGPSAILSITMYQTVGKKYGLQHIILTTFCAGMVQVLMGLFGLGFIIDFISGPVSTGFTSAAALIILTSQVKDILSIEASGSTFVSNWDSIIRNIHNASIPDAVVGIGCIVALLVLRILGNKQFGVNDENKEPHIAIKIINKLIWIIGISRNALCVVTCGFISYRFCLEGDPPFHITGDVPKGLPEFKLPPFGYSQVINGTTVEHSVGYMMSNIGSGVLVVALIALLEDIAVCKAFSHGNPIDATQEFIAVGLCNIANSFVQSFAINGPLARGAVNNASGVRTTLAGLYSGTIVILSLLFFTPYFRYIPKAALAGIIISAVIFMVEIKVTKSMWKTKRSCFFVALVTFIACLVLPLEIGIVVGIGVNLLFILYHAARPKITLEKLTSSSGIDYLRLTPDRSLVFPSVVYVRKLVNKFSIPERVPVVIDCSHIYSADYTAAQTIESLTKDFTSRKQPLLFYNIKPSVSSVFQGLTPNDLVMFYNEDELNNLLTMSCSRKKENEVVSTKC